MASTLPEMLYPKDSTANALPHSFVSYLTEDYIEKAVLLIQRKIRQGKNLVESAKGQSNSTTMKLQSSARTANTQAVKESKPKRKKFSLFSKSRKNKASTPDTVGEERDRADELLARSLLADLDLAAADTGAEGEAEGTELILPSPEYAVVAPPAEVVEEEKPTGEASEEKETPELDENEAVVEEEKKEDDADTTDDTAIDTAIDTAVENAIVKEEFERSMTEAASAAAELFTTALNCTVTTPEKLSETLQASCLIPDAVDLDNMFDNKTGVEFLHDMTNVGFTLVYHREIDEDSWIGRTVTMVFRPGVCSAEKIVEPAIEWRTMVGGKSTIVETKAMELFSIDSVNTSNDGGTVELETIPNTAKPPIREDKEDASQNISMCNISFSSNKEEEFDCFFTITSEDGEIHLFEGLNKDDCYRVVAGIRYSAQRLTEILIEGDSSALIPNFYDNSQVPEESKLTEKEVLNKLSNIFLDKQ